MCVCSFTTQQKRKKQGSILRGTEMFALWKGLYFYSKMHSGQDVSLYIFFVVVYLHTSPTPFLSCLFTSNQLWISLIDTDSLKTKFVLRYALYYTKMNCKFSCFLGRGATSIRCVWVYASSFHLTGAWVSREHECEHGSHGSMKSLLLIG